MGAGDDGGGQDGDQAKGDEREAEARKSGSSPAHLAFPEPDQEGERRQQSEPVVPGPVGEKEVVARVEGFAVGSLRRTEMEAEGQRAPKGSQGWNFALPDRGRSFGKPHNGGEEDEIRGHQGMNGGR